MTLRDEDVTRLAEATSYHDVCLVALECMRLQAERSRPVGLGMVCGPISTGGLGKKDLNLKRFALAINALQASGRHIFSQMPYEDALHRIRDATVGPDVYDMKLLEEFYLPLFESGHVRRKFFIPGWDTSDGAKWERGHATRLGIEIIDLGEDLLPR